MKSKIQFLALVLLGIMLSINQVWAESKTITPAAVSGDVVTDIISFTTAKNGGTSAPIFNSNAIRLYQNSSANVSNGTRGGSITFTAASGYVINQVTIANQNSNDCNGGTVAYQKNGTGSWLGSASVTKGTNYSTGSDLGASSVEIACFGTTKLNRLYITSITVVYASTSSGSTYTVNFNANGGTVTPTSATQTSAGASISLPTPTYAGHSCTGWYTASSGGTKRGDAGGDYVPTSNETLYAQWVLTTMDQIYAKATEVQGTATDVTITFNNWVVTGVSSTGKNVYVTDGTKGFQIYGSSSLGFTAGDILSGTVSCKVELYKQAAQLTLLTSSTPGLTVTEGGSKTAETVATSTLGGVNTGRLVTYSNMTYNSSNQTLSDGSNSVKIYNQLYNFSALTNGKNYNITGVYLRFGDVNEILPRSAGDIEEKVKTVVSIAVTTAPKTSYTTCENLVLGDWVVTATYNDATQEDVTAGCTFSPANGAKLSTSDAIVTVTHTSGKTIDKPIDVTTGAQDTFIDNLHANAIQYGDCNGYTVPSLDDATQGDECEGQHYKFIGWSKAQLYTNQHPTEPSGLLKAGATHNADGSTYYAVWAKEQH